MVDPLVAIQDSAINAGSNALGGIINMAVVKTVDFLFGDTKEDRKNRLDKYYNRVKTIVDQHQPDLSLGGTPFTTPQHRIMQELDEVDESIMDALRKMENAKNKSRCGVCRSDLEETIHLMKERVAPIFDAQDKIRAIQQLKENGKLPQDALWETLSPDEKKRVEKLAERIAKPRDTSGVVDRVVLPPIEPRRMPLPKLIGGINGDGEEESEPAPRKRRRSPSKGRKGKATRKSQRNPRRK